MTALRAALVAALLPAGLAGDVPPAGEPWKTVAPGVEVGRLPSKAGGPIVTVVRVEPRQNAFRLLSARLEGLSEPLTAPQWAARTCGITVCGSTAVFITIEPHSKPSCTSL